jgi:hypothetical protein
MSAQFVFGILVVLGYVIAPVVLIWGWTRWAVDHSQSTICSILSLMSFILASASAVLAVSTVVYAQIHHFPYYDPTLLRIFRWGLLLSLAGILCGIGGVWRRNTLRWYAPISGLGTLAFWIMAASGE